MTRHLIAGLLALALPAGMPGPGAAPAREVRLSLAILPCANIETTFKKFHPLLAYLKSATGMAVTLVVPADLPDFEAATASGQIDFALQDPHTYQQLSHLFDGSSLLQTRGLDGTFGQSGVVIVRRDSGVSDLTQLRGKTVMFGPRTSSPKWIAAKLLFESRGLHLDRDLKWRNGGCCEDIAFAVVVGAVAAGVTCDHFLGLHRARQADLGIEPDVLQIIGRTRAFPTRIFAARAGTSAEAIAAITRALLQLDPANPAHAPVLAGAEIRGFVRTTEAEYLRGLDGLDTPRRP